MSNERWHSWTSPTVRGGIMANLASTPSRTINSTPPRSQYQPPASRVADGTSQMGGVGLVFYRDPGTPYLIVKEVVADGPAFKSSLIYPGDKLCCINDFDLSWSGSTPRSQQPQLPGPHGTAVTLTFDRSTDSKYPERFTITLIRSQGFYPDRLSSSPYRQESGGSTKNPTASENIKHAAPETVGQRTAQGSQGSVLAQSQAQTQPVQRVITTDYATISTQASASPAVAPQPIQRSPAAPRPYSGYEGWEARSDPGSAGSQDDVNELIQEIARKDRVLDLQRKLSAVEQDHEKQIKDFQKNQAVLEELVRSLRGEVDASRSKAAALEQQLGGRSTTTEQDGEHQGKVKEMQAQLARERAQWQAAEKRLVAERDRALDQVNGFEERVRKQLRELEGEVEKERGLRAAAEAKAPGMDISLLRQIQTEKELLEAQNEDLRRELMEMKIHFSETQRAPPHSSALSALSAPRPPSDRKAPDAGPSSAAMTNAGWEVPGLQLPHAVDPTPSTPDASHDVELHQSPASARVSRDSQRDDPPPSAPAHAGQAPNGTPTSEAGARPARVIPTPKPSATAPLVSNPPPRPDPARFQHAAFNGAGPPGAIAQGAANLKPPAQPQPLSNPTHAHPPSDPRATPGSASHVGPRMPPPPQTSSIPPMTRDPPDDRVRHAEPPSPPTPPGSGVVRAGIGMSFHEDPGTGRYLITDVHPLGPAGKAVAQGVMALGDALLAVDAAPTQGRTVPSIVDDILGQEGTPVQLTVARAQQPAHPFVVSLIRSRPQTAQQPSPSLPPSRAASSSSSGRRPPSPQTALSPGGPEKMLLPPGWVVEVDPTTGRSYYVNHALKTFSWARPGTAAGQHNGRR